MIPSTQHTLEELAFNAWPAAHIQQLDGWLLRYTNGITGRANSVWPNRHGGQIPLAEKLNQVELFYRTKSLPPRFMLTNIAQPENLKEVLLARGYQASAPVAVQTAKITHLLKHIQPRLPDFTLNLTSRWHSAWGNFYHAQIAKNQHEEKTRAGIIQRILNPTAFLTVQNTLGEIVAIGLGVSERNWVGIYCMVTAPKIRRKGLASTILRGIAQWANTQKASQLYLQVSTNNPPALALYAKLGFTTAYQYQHYLLNA